MFLLCRTVLTSPCLHVYDEESNEGRARGQIPSYVSRTSDLSLFGIYKRRRVYRLKDYNAFI